MPRPQQASPVADEEDLRSFGPLPTKKSLRLLKGTLSVFLTLAGPETAATESGVSLLSTPEALWTVLIIIINGPKSLTHDFRRESTQYLTPLAQFVRGACYVITLQKWHIEEVAEAVKSRVNELVGLLSGPPMFTASCVIAIRHHGPLQKKPGTQ